MITSKEVAALNIDLFLWLPISKGYCTLHELRTVYDLDDLLDMHEMIQVTSKVDERSAKV